MSYRPLTTSVLLLFGSADSQGRTDRERDLPSSDLLLLLLLKSCPVAAAAVFQGFGPFILLCLVLFREAVLVGRKIQAKINGVLVVVVVMMVTVMATTRWAERERKKGRESPSILSLSFNDRILRCV